MANKKADEDKAAGRFSYTLTASLVGWGIMLLVYVLNHIFAGYSIMHRGESLIVLLMIILALLGTLIHSVNFITGSVCLVMKIIIKEPCLDSRFVTGFMLSAIYLVIPGQPHLNFS